MKQRKVAALVIVAVVAVIVTGGLMAGNMGFRFNFEFQEAAGTGCPGGPSCVSNSGTQAIGLPYNRQQGVDKASHLFRDIGSTLGQLNQPGGGFGSCGKRPCACLANIQRYDSDTDSNAPYACGSADFDLNPGEGYLVQAAAIGGDFLMVGSHNPLATISLVAAGDAVPAGLGGDGLSGSGTQRYTHPYHAVSANASELMAELGGCRFGKKVSNIQKYDSTTDQNQPYSCGLADFTLEPGNSYLVQTGTGAVPGGIDYIPAHY